MNLDSLLAAMRDTMEDARLSRSERHALRELFDDARLDEKDRATLRRVAFELVRDELDHQDVRQLVHWLEATVKILTPRETSGTSIADTAFSPKDDCVQRITNWIASTRTRLDICVFTITDDRITRAIESAHRRSVRVRVASDNEKAYDLGSDIQKLEKAGVPVAVDTSPHHMHHKFAIFDQRAVLTGSYNWTRSAAQHNQENFIVSDDRRLISSFQKEFDALWNRFS